MKTSEIKKLNPTLLEDLKKVRGIMALVPRSRIFVSVKKSELLKEAESNKIEYELNDKIFVSKRTVLLIL